MDLKKFLPKTISAASKKQNISESTSANADKKKESDIYAQLPTAFGAKKRQPQYNYNANKKYKTYDEILEQTKQKKVVQEDKKEEVKEEEEAGPEIPDFETNEPEESNFEYPLPNK